MLVPAHESACGQLRGNNSPEPCTLTVVELDEVPRHRAYLSCSSKVSNKGMGGGKVRAVRVEATRKLYLGSESEYNCAMPAGGICGAAIACLLELQSPMKLQRRHSDGDESLRDPEPLRESQL